MKLALSLSFALGLVIVACGGSAPQAEAPRENSVTPSSSYGEEPEEEPIAKGPDCSDGTCFTCGAGVCPSGAYCDQGAPGGAACAWLPECSKTPSCACVKKVLGASCSCDETSGNPLVSCN